MQKSDIFEIIFCLKFRLLFKNMYHNRFCMCKLTCNLKINSNSLRINSNNSLEVWSILEIWIFFWQIFSATTVYNSNVHY